MGGDRKEMGRRVREKGRTGQGKERKSRVQMDKREGREVKRVREVGKEKEGGKFRRGPGG